MNLDEFQIALQKDDWDPIFFKYPANEEPYSSQIDDLTYWKKLRLTWQYADEIWINEKSWRELLMSNRAAKEEFMEPDERIALESLSNPIEIFRGHLEHNADGWSWSTSREKAMEFPVDEFGLPMQTSRTLSIAKVNKTDVIAYLTHSLEYEIIIPPETVYDRSTEPIPPMSR
jgi:hypothetical protein